LQWQCRNQKKTGNKITNPKSEDKITIIIHTMVRTQLVPKLLSRHHSPMNNAQLQNREVYDLLSTQQVPEYAAINHV
jgi:hypothetical protein